MLSLLENNVFHNRMCWARIACCVLFHVNFANKLPILPFTYSRVPPIYYTPHSFRWGNCNDWIFPETCHQWKLINTNYPTLKITYILAKLFHTQYIIYMYSFFNKYINVLIKYRITYTTTTTPGIIHQLLLFQK